MVKKFFGRTLPVEVISKRIMKKLPFLVSGLFLLSISFSAAAQKLVEEGKQWNIVIQPTFTPNYSSYALMFEGDTAIDNRIYKKIFLSTDSLNTDWTPFSQYIREDTSGKVYLKYRDQEEKLLYDFSLAVGDTFQIDYGFACNLLVLDIDSVPLNNGETRKRLKVVNADYSFLEPDFWIEGIGSMAGLLSHAGWHCATDYSEKLLCYYENGELVFPANPSSCFVTAVGEQSVGENIDVYPNPFTDEVHIAIEERNTLIECIQVYNMTGLKVRQDAFHTAKIRLDLSGLPNGIFFLLVETNRGKRCFKRIIKQGER